MIEPAKEILCAVVSQDLYAPSVLADAERQGAAITRHLNGSTHKPEGVELVFVGVITTEEEALALAKRAENDPNVLGVAFWPKTFSPSGFHMEAFSVLREAKVPVLVLNTQYLAGIPYLSLDMLFMNGNQTAHGVLEFCFGLRLSGVGYLPISGYWQDDAFNQRVGQWIEKVVAGEVPTLEISAVVRKELDPVSGVVSADSIPAQRRHELLTAVVADSRSIKCLRFGPTMWDVQVTLGDVARARRDLGVRVHDMTPAWIADIADGIPDEALKPVLAKWRDEFDWSRIGLDSQKHESVAYQARVYLAIQQLLQDHGATAFTTGFQSTQGLRDLPGLAVQALMADGYGFGPEGDWKSAYLGRLVHLALEKLQLEKGWWSLAEDYVYDFPGKAILYSHMLEVSTAAAEGKPVLDVFPLDIGRSGNPARALFNVKEGKAHNICLLDINGRWELVVIPVEVFPGESTPMLETARAMARLNGKGDFTDQLDAACVLGACHHKVMICGFGTNDIEVLAKAMGAHCLEL